MSVTVRYRPLDPPWGEETYPRTRPRFAATYTQTMDLLIAEVDHLGAREVVIQVDARESQIRQDGFLRSDSSIEFPGVRVAFESRHGPLTYSTDEFTNGSAYKKGRNGKPSRMEYFPAWHMNLRAIALSLQALRTVDRYGVSGHGEQYRGWNALPPGVPMGPATMTVDAAARLLSEATSKTWTPEETLASEKVVGLAFRMAAKRHHPDMGGDPVKFDLLRQAKEVLTDG